MNQTTVKLSKIKVSLKGSNINAWHKEILKFVSTSMLHPASQIFFKNGTFGKKGFPWSFGEHEGCSFTCAESVAPPGDFQQNIMLS